MSSLFASLLNATGTLQVYHRAFNVIQNNISNVNTPGYVRQDQVILSLPFDPASGLTGGVLPGPMLSARSEFLDQSVRNRQEFFGSAQQRAADLGQIETLFDVTGQSGIAAAFNKLFGGFSQLAVNPNDPVARQNIIDRAGTTAEAFHHVSRGIARVSTNVEQQIGDSVAAINRLAARVAQINTQYRGNIEAQNDAGLAAQLHSTLEELSEIVNYTVIKTPDGAANVYIGGQTPVVIGDHVYAVAADLSGPQAVILDWQNANVTPQLIRGRLGSLIEERNTTLPGYQAELNQLAASFADTVNTALAAGLDRNGAAPTTDLFFYGTPADAALSIGVTAITADEIAAASPGAPGGNGNALAVARLLDTPAISGFTFTQFYGNLGGRVGRDIGSAREEREQYRDSVAQARATRTDQTGVSLDEEAAKLLQFQQGYQAIGKLVQVLDQLTVTLLELVN